jgi:hypothetical protein
MRRIIEHVAALTGCVLLATASQAQFPGAPPGGFGGPGGGFGGGYGGYGGYNRPAVSPYLNLNRGGDPAINYYGLVRPQLQYNRALQNVGNDINFLESNLAAAQAQQQPAQTGHGASFMTQYQYFMNNGGGRLPGNRPFGAGGIQTPQQPRTR